ncbi:MAG: sigma-70 family RNA polymerase sigma factor [Armatimonadetes bacterium]|nr:sigma-70 family RNA polymerase sigma factor [Armatimonadota bacterium]MDW8121128.1 sigma-70 family RNA polymerase sigma factor [Armatimonadota bacterium]
MGEKVKEDQIWNYWQDIRKLAHRICPRREDAEDVAQSTLLKAVQNLEGFRGEATIRTWLHRIATNECLMLQRGQKDLSLEEFLESGIGDDEGAPKDIPLDGPDPEEIAAQAEIRRLIVQALERLPERYRTVLLLKDGEGVKEKDIAQALGISLLAVKALLHRARSALKKEVGKLMKDY